jgi:oligopeptide transport system substrate-binding protein
VKRRPRLGLRKKADNHKLTAEAIQQVWRQNLNVNATLLNQEEKVYFDPRRQMNYQIYRSTWIGDYLDPNSFLDLWVTNGTNNQTAGRIASMTD